MSKVKSSDDDTRVNREFRCRKKFGEKRISVCNDTWFEKHKISMEDVLFIIYCFVHNLYYASVNHDNRRNNLLDETISDIFSFSEK